MTHERPLVFVTDESLLDEVLRLAAAVGCEVERAPDVVSARGNWFRAPLVVIDELALTHDLPRRSNTLLVTKANPNGSDWDRILAAGVERVHWLPEREAELTEALADAAEPPVRGGCVIGVLGGRGGGGASVFAAALAHRAAGEEGGTLLVDCDPLGGGLELLLGAEKIDGISWRDLHLDGGRISMSDLSAALPEYGTRGRRLSLLSCDADGPGPTAAAIASVVDAGYRAGRAVICDLPRNPGPVIDAVVARADLIAIVLPAEVRACAAAKRIAARLRAPEERLRLVVRGPTAGGKTLGPAQVAQSVGLPVLTSMAPDRRLSRALEAAEFEPSRRGALATAARITLAAARRPTWTSRAAA